MLRSMYAGISGMKNFQTKLDVIGNNIANVNTSGFKKGRVTFQDMMSQTTSGAQGPTANRGGVNPYQVGLGSQLGSIDNIHTQGFRQTTNRPLDLALEGDGMFVVAGNTNRPSAAITAAEATLASARATLTAAQSRLTIAQTTLATAESTKATAQAEIDAADGDADIIAAAQAKINDAQIIIDAAPEAIQAAETEVAAAQTPYQTAANALRELLNWDVNLDTSNVSYTRAGAFYLDTDGAVVSPEGLYLVGFGAGTNTFSTINIPKDAQSFSIQTDGVVNYIDANGDPQIAGQVALANFSNAAGLQKAGSNLFLQSPNSGIPTFSVAETEGTASMVAGSLEMSNVDLAEEFTEMIVAQRGFQANTRIISTSDEILQELVNLKR